MQYRLQVGIESKIKCIAYLYKTASVDFDNHFRCEEEGSGNIAGKRHITKERVHFKSLWCVQ